MFRLLPGIFDIVPLHKNLAARGLPGIVPRLTALGFRVVRLPSPDGLG